MNPKTLQALKASITHWEENLALCEDDLVTEITLGANNCALCKLHKPPYTECVDCPIQKASGWSYCRGTPYAGGGTSLDQWMERLIYAIGADQRGSLIQELKGIITSHVKDEVEFLKTLLPKERRKRMKQKAIISITRMPEEPFAYHGSLETYKNDEGWLILSPICSPERKTRAEAARDINAVAKAMGLQGRAK